MREIRFRAWDKERKRMISSFTIDSLANGWLNDSGHGGGGYEDKYDYLEFTGLKDKNGKEIYEGDIVRNASGSFEVIEWGESNEFPDTEDHSTTYIGFGFLGDNIEIEVIGNIYEKPELLNERN